MRHYHFVIVLCAWLAGCASVPEPRDLAVLDVHKTVNSKAPPVCREPNAPATCDPVSRLEVFIATHTNLGAFEGQDSTFIQSYAYLCDKLDGRLVFFSHGDAILQMKTPGAALSADAAIARPLPDGTQGYIYRFGVPLIEFYDKDRVTYYNGPRYNLRAAPQDLCLALGEEPRAGRYVRNFQFLSNVVRIPAERVRALLR